MTTLMIIDLASVETIDRDGMRAIRGGIAYLTNPDSGNAIPGLPPSITTSWPGAGLLKDLHIPGSLTSTGRPPQDPRLA
jgi:hypothetical protein